MSLLIKISIIQALVIAPIEIPIGLCAVARGPPLSQMIRNVNENWEGTLMGLTARKDGAK